TSADSASSSSMISLHRSMHSSQMYTPGPAMSFFTCFCDFPQNEHFSRSPPSPIRATYVLPALTGPLPVADRLLRTCLFAHLIVQAGPAPSQRRRRRLGSLQLLL